MNLISKARAKKILFDFRNKEILVIGDIMLDRYIWGSVNRISPEAPVPVVKFSKETVHLGGAGNVASNIVSLDGRVSCLSVIGEDFMGREVAKKLRNIGADTSGIIEDPSRNTTVKTRIIAHSQQVVRIDREVDSAVSRKIEDMLIKRVKARLGHASCVIISDYDKGIITKRLLKVVLNDVQKRKIPVAIDPKLNHFASYKPATVITPNLLEASRATAIEFKKDKDIRRAGRKILTQNRCRGVLITMGDKGMLLFERGNLPYHIQTVAKEVYDVTGAGDTVISTIALCLASGASLKEASIIANHAAGIVVGKIGTATVSSGELLESLTV